MFGEGVFLQFESVRIRVPKEYEKYLIHLYGERYMELPPENERNHHAIDEIVFLAEENEL